MLGHFRSHIIRSHMEELSCITFVLMFFSFVLQLMMDERAFVESVSDADHHTSLVYRGCGNQGSYDANTLTPFLDSIVKQSSVSRFYTASDSGVLSGLFQCRGDLSNDECHDCVNQAQQMALTVCGQASSAARIQFKGCYILYAASGVTLNYGSDLLNKACSPTNVAGAGFEERRDMALQTMSDQVSKNHGFYTTDFESVYVLAQCEGDLVDSECGECVKTAVQKAQVECGSSVAGEAYLDKCFITYSYSPNGVPKPIGSSTVSSPSTETKTNKRTTADYILICAAVGGTVLLCMVLARSRRRK